MEIQNNEAKQTVANAFQATRSKLEFVYYPGFAKFVKEFHLHEYVNDLIALAKRLDIPLMRRLADLPEEQLINLSLQSHGEFLDHAINNKLGQLLQGSLAKWEGDNLEIVGMYDIMAEDIHLVSYLRKQCLSKFLPLYTQDLDEMMGVLHDIDSYEVEAGIRGTNTFIMLLKRKIDQHAHFIESITNTSPAAIYIFDLVHQKQVYTNGRFGEMLGFTISDIQQLGVDTLSALIHPDDLSKAQSNIQMLCAAKDGEIFKTEYRVKNAKGEYRWLRTHESIFKRDKNGKVDQIIGISIDITEEKEKSIALKKREEQLSEAQAIAELGSFERNLITGEVEVTEKLKEILDLENADDLQSEVMSKVHPSDKQKLRDALDESRKTGIYECEYRLITRTGEERVIWSRGKVEFNNGIPSMFKGTVMNVSDKHQMLRKLQISDELYKQAQALTHIGNWYWDITTNSLTWTDELYRIYGLEPGIDITYEMLSSFNHENDVDFVAQTMQQAITSLQPFNFYYRIILPNNSVKTLHAIGEVLADDGKAYKLIGTLQDVSTQKLLERELIEKNEFINKIAETTPTLITSYNVNTGKYTFINKAIEINIGYTPEDALQRGIQFFTNIIHPDDLPVLMEQSSKAVAEANENPQANGKEAVVDFKYRMRHKNGQYRWFHTFGTVFDRDEQGKVQHFLNVSVDITEQEASLQELQQMNLKLQQSNASLEEYAYVASHDLKEPMRKIATLSDRLLLTQNNNLSEDGKTYLEKIIEASRRMQTMISDLLAVSVISNNKAYTNYSLKAIVQEVLQGLEHKILESQATINVSELPEVKIVPSQFRQLVQNLVANSLKFKREGVLPVIRIYHTFLNAQQVSSFGLPAGRYLKLEVSDNGIGFDNRHAAKIFAIFQRLHTRSTFEGTGIGLAICKKIVENHEGIIFAQGVPNQGATFTIIIPL